MALTAEIEDFEIAAYLAQSLNEESFGNFAQVIWILTDWYRPYQMTGALEGVESHQFVARKFGEWLAEREDGEYTDSESQIGFFVNVVKSYRETKEKIKNANR